MKTNELLLEKTVDTYRVLKNKQRVTVPSLEKITEARSKGLPIFFYVGRSLKLVAEINYLIFLKVATVHDGDKLYSVCGKLKTLDSEKYMLKFKLYYSRLNPNLIKFYKLVLLN